MINKQILKNNIVFISENLENFSTACIGFWIKTGSRFEEKNLAGISHFTEHLVFKGTKNFSTQEISCTFDRMGAYINAFTERENVCFYCTIPVAENKTKNLSKALDVLCELTENAIFPEDEFLREKLVVQNEISSLEDDCDEKSLDVLASSMWPNQKISRSITGTISDVEKITREMIFDWYKKFFVKGELIVIATGNLDENLISEKLNKMNVHKKVLTYPKEFYFKNDLRFASGSKFVKSHFKQIQFFESYNIKTPLKMKDFFVGSVFNAFAGDSLSSRLFSQIREKMALCYNVYSFFTFYENAAIWCATASCDKKNIAELKNQMEKVILELASKEISDFEYENAVEHICGEEIIGSEDPEYLMKRLQNYNSLGFDLLETSEICKSIRSVSKNDIIEFAKNLIVKEKKCQLIYGRKKCQIK